MPNVRSTSLKKYDISSHRFLELYHFCLQYQEWRDELKFNMDTVGSAEITGMPLTHKVSDATSRLALRRSELEKRCELIEQTAIEADPDIYPYLLKAVTSEHVSYHYLKTIMNIPCGKKMYYDRRRKFYWLLDKKK